MANLKSRIARLVSRRGWNELDPLQLALKKYSIDDRLRSRSLDEIMLLDTIMALYRKDDETDPKSGFARDFLTWASSRPELTLIERAEKLIQDLTLEPPTSWKAPAVDPDAIQPPYAWFCKAEQYATCPEWPFWTKPNGDQAPR